MRVRLQYPILLLQALACNVGDTGAGGIVRDSAGVQIVDNAAPAWTAAEAWRIGEELGRAGTEEGAGGQLLHGVMGAVQLSDGSIVIADGGSSQLRRYSPDGQYLGSSGGAGEGPGEFRALSWVGRSARDSILAWDARLMRVSVFSPEGESIRTYMPAVDDEFAGQRVIGTATGGRLVMTRGSSFEPVGGESGVQRQPVTVWLIGATGAIEESIGPFPGETVELRLSRDGGGIIRTPVPYGAHTLIAASSNRIYVSEVSGYGIQVFGLDGRLERIIRRPHEAVSVTPEDVSAWIESRLAPLPPVEEIRAGRRASFEAVTPADRMPPLRSMLVDVAGNLWVESGRHAGSELATWSVFNEIGEWLSEVTVDASVEILEIGRHTMIVLVRNELDVESVRVLSLVRPGAADGGGDGGSG